MIVQKKKITDDYRTDVSATVGYGMSFFYIELFKAKISQIRLREINKKVSRSSIDVLVSILSTGIAGIREQLPKVEHDEQMRCFTSLIDGKSGLVVDISGEREREQQLFK